VIISNGGLEELDLTERRRELNRSRKRASKERKRKRREAAAKAQASLRSNHSQESPYFVKRAS
jgi:hypothetical protein